MTQPVPHPYVIEASDNQPLYIRIRDILLTAIMWGIYFYLMTDFFAFLHTLYHWELFGVVGAELEKALQILDTMEVYLYVIFLNSLLLISWAIYNRVRFRGKDRRRARPVIGALELGQLYGFSEEEVKSWQGMPILTIHHDADGRIEKVDPEGMRVRHSAAAE